MLVKLLFPFNKEGVMYDHRSTEDRRGTYLLWTLRGSLLLASTIGTLALVSACAMQPRVATPKQGRYPSTEALRSVPSAPAPSEAPTSVAQPSTSQAQAPMSEVAPLVSPSPAEAPRVQGPAEEGLYPPTEALSSVPPAPASGSEAAPSITPSQAGGEVVALPPVPPREQPVTQVAQGARRVLSLEDIFFDFDRAEIRPDAKAALKQDIAWLRAHPTAGVTIEGHCDERGTSEYNLGLGERRAKVARDFLVAMGIDPGRLSMISYGKERPFVPGHDESAWKWNRRDHMVVVKK